METITISNWFTPIYTHSSIPSKHIVVWHVIPISDTLEEPKNMKRSKVSVVSRTAVKMGERVTRSTQILSPSRLYNITVMDTCQYIFIQTRGSPTLNVSSNVNCGLWVMAVCSVTSYCDSVLTHTPLWCRMLVVGEISLGASGRGGGNMGNQ